MEKGIARTFQSARAALHVESAVFAVGRFAEAGEIVEVKIHVVGNHQVDETISVIVAKCGSGRPAAVGNASLGGHIRERAVPVVVIEHVPAQAGDIQVGPSVIVEIPYRPTHGEARSTDASLVGYIGKSAVVIEHVPAQAGDIQVGPSVIVEIPYRPTHGEARSTDASLVGYIGKSAVVIVPVQG